jgi:exosortase/archaeosortase family protein
VNSHRQLQKTISDLICKGIATSHGRIVLLGLLVGFCYFPAWIGYLAPRALKGASGWFLIASMLYLATTEILSKRQQLQKLRASEEDRLLGNLLILSGVVLFPFCRFALWSQAIVWLVVLAGIVCSCWGISFFNTFQLPTFLISLTVYPRIGIISRTAWEFITPPNFLENFMAWSSAAALQAVGQSASADGKQIILPAGAVEVGWGCNGLDMAITIAVAGLFMGLIFKLNRLQIIGLMTLAVALALPANIPRLMLVTVAYVYWGRQWFDFWHGFWGGQIFATTLFTLYYYIMMALMKKRFDQART